MEIRRLPSWIQTNEDLELYHHGIKGQRWGVRRYQNPDGTLTDKGIAKLKKYQDVETRGLAVDATYYQNKIDKKTKKYNKKINKVASKGDEKKTEKLKNKLSNDKEIKHYRNMIESAKKQITMVKNMSFDDMTREKKLKRIEIAESALAAGLAAGVMTMSMSVLAPTTAIGAAMAKNSTPIILATTSASRPGSMGSYKDKVQKDRLKRWNERYNT